MLVDYADILTRLEQALGRAYAETPSILNVPGASAALKLDPFYYLALRPLFHELLGKWAAVPPGRVEETLARTGNLVLGPGKARFTRPLSVFEEATGTRLQLTADFVPASCIDRAVTLYGGSPGPLPVSGLRLAADQRPELDAFFAETTPLAALCFGKAPRA
ncbi:MAG: hypothetical protein AAGU21_05005 [Solidesulfovibrio sp.]|uniref:hypothetical protein n=1 Tax=Solidesulfovibrio sp. TaxID=2910990 RepID=UPI002B20E87E|nr:hypothetical protein [Solidesulfovibrio sp.]MEA4855964.1 hypothetical protein [Solidesulfovibrio sp.]